MRSRVRERHVVSSRSARPAAIIAALSAPADEPATSRMRTPASASAATAPASYAPLAPPPVRISAVGTSRPIEVGTHVATAPGGAASAMVVSVASVRKIGARATRAFRCASGNEHRGQRADVLEPVGILDDVDDLARLRLAENRTGEAHELSGDLLARDRAHRVAAHHRRASLEPPAVAEHEPHVSRGRIGAAR